MKILQRLGLLCQHSNKSIPVCRRRTCLDCGEVFEFSSYDLNESDHQVVDHYKVTERSLNRISKRLLQWKKQA